MFSIPRMEVGWIVIIPEHCDYNTIKSRYLRHRFYSYGLSSAIAPAQWLAAWRRGWVATNRSGYRLRWGHARAANPPAADCPVPSISSPGQWLSGSLTSYNVSGHRSCPPAHCMLPRNGLTRLKALGSLSPKGWSRPAPCRRVFLPSALLLAACMSSLVGAVFHVSEVNNMLISDVFFGSQVKR